VSDCISFFRTFYSGDESLLLTMGGDEGSSLIDKIRFGNTMTQTSGTCEGRRDQASSLRPNNLAVISAMSRSLPRVQMIQRLSAS
jgi:hypothetical protein